MYTSEVMTAMCSACRAQADVPELVLWCSNALRVVHVQQQQQCIGSGASTGCTVNRCVRLLGACRMRLSMAPCNFHLQQWHIVCACVGDIAACEETHSNCTVHGAKQPYLLQAAALHLLLSPAPAAAASAASAAAAALQPEHLLAPAVPARALCPVPSLQKSTHTLHVFQLWQLLWQLLWFPCVASLLDIENRSSTKRDDEGI